MQNITSELFICGVCLLCNIIAGSLVIFHTKDLIKFNFKIFLGLFFGNLTSNALLLNILFLISQSTPIILFIIIQIAVLQIFLFIFIRYIRHQEVTFSLFLFSWLLFSTFRLSGTYHLLQIILPEFSSLEISLITLFFSEFFYVLCITLVSIYFLSIFCKKFSKTFIFHSVLVLCWVSIGFFGITPFIDLLLNSVGITPYFTAMTPKFIGLNLVVFRTYGTIILYLFTTITIFLGSIFLGYKSGFKFLPESTSILKKRVMRYFGIASIIILLSYGWYWFIIFIDSSTAIVFQITYMFDFTFYNLTHPFWVLLIIYYILLLIIFYWSYIISIIIRQRNHLWDQPNYFNQLPIINICGLVFIGFILCYFNYKKFSSYSYLQPLFVLLSIILYLTLFCILLTIFILTYRKRIWNQFSSSLKLFLLYIPFFIGYFLAGQILTINEILFGILSCTSLGIYAHHLRNDSSPSIPLNYPYLALMFFWAVLSACFAVLLSITSLICVIISIISFSLLHTYSWRLNRRFISYGLILSAIVIMGGTSSTFSTLVFALGIPNTLVFGVTLLMFVTVLIYTYIRD